MNLNEWKLEELDYFDALSTLDDMAGKYANINESYYSESDYDLLRDLIIEHFNNKSATYDDIGTMEQYYDIKVKQWCLMSKSLFKDLIYVWHFCEDTPLEFTREDFEENRFFVKKVG